MADAELSSGADAGDRSQVPFRKKGLQSKGYVALVHFCNRVKKVRLGFQSARGVPRPCVDNGENWESTTAGPTFMAKRSRKVFGL